MAATTVGEIQLIAKIDTSEYKKGEKEIKKSNESMERSGARASGKLSKGFSTLAKVGLAAVATATVAVTAALTKAATASWNQVSAVEQATVGLRAYEKDASKVDSVLASLIKYARSDMGVLFNRKDLFQSAQMLKLNGVNTEDLSKNVQILSRSVGLGLGNWDDLNNVVGRVVSTGRLTGIEFDQLTKYGFKLDKSLRNTNISATDLFEALDKGIPVDAMAGQANTIKGLGIRLETAFRGIGDAVLGVDSDTSKFVKGGLGDLITRGLAVLPSYLKTVSGEISKFIESAKELYKQVGDYLGPKLETLAKTVEEDLVPILKDLWKNVIEPLVPVLGTVLVGAIGLVTDALNLALSAFSWVWQAMKDGNPIVWLLIGTFGALATAMTLNATFNALTTGFNTLRVVTIPNVLTTLNTLKIAVATPMVFGAVVIGAALAAFALIRQKAEETMAVIRNTQAAIDKASKSDDEVINRLRNLSKNGTPEQRARAESTLRKLAETGSFASGGFTGLGSKYDIAGVVHRGEFVIPKEMVDQNTGLPKMRDNNTTINQYNTINNNVDIEVINRNLAWRLSRV